MPSRSRSEASRAERSKGGSTAPSTEGAARTGARPIEKGMDATAGTPERPADRAGDWSAAARGEEAPARDSRQPATAGGALLVEDDTSAGPGQMRKSEFMRVLRAQICASVDGAMKGTGRDSRGCPWIDHWLGYYEGRTATQIERSLRRYAPEAGSASTARDYVPVVAARIRRSAERYAATGEVSGVPDDMPDGGMPGGGILAGFGGMFFKARPGGPRDPGGAVAGGIGAGQPLPSALRSQMEPAFGTSFSGVRLHTDAAAGQLSDRMNARAFTVGRDIVFGAGEYQPGTLTGDALIAHELAHVSQQGGGPRAAEVSGGAADQAYEEDADASAAAAVLSSRGDGRLRAGASARRHARPNLRAGLRLQRCSSDKPAATPNLQTDKKLRQNWEEAFQEGLRVLNRATSQPGDARGCAFTGEKPADQWRYDDENWRKITAEHELTKYRIAYEPRKLPHESVDALFEHLERWECDCALFSELPWLYAWRHTLAVKEFDQKFAKLRLRPHDSTGLEREDHNRENIELGLERGNFDKLWEEAPVGTKVNWKNESQHARSPWDYENAVKSGKGRTPAQDLYDAHPLGSRLTEAEVKRKLAENAPDFPGNFYEISDQTLAALKQEGAPAEFVKGLAPLKGQRFIGRNKFFGAIANAQQALRPLASQDRAKYTRIMTVLFDQARPGASEADKDQYVKTYIKRHEIQIPK